MQTNRKEKRILFFIVNFILMLSLSLSAVNGQQENTGAHAYTDTKHSNNRFLQETATVFTEEDGLPAMVFKELRRGKGGTIIALSADEQFIYNGENWEHFSNSLSDLRERKRDCKEDVLCKVEYQEKVYHGKNNGLFRKDKNADEWIEVFPADKNYSWKLSNVNVLKADSKDRLWFGSSEGIGYLYDGQWHLFTGKEGLPYKSFTCIADAPNGDIWFGTTKGAIRTDGKNFHYRFSRRWLPDDHVNDILIEEDGTVWLATDKGISRISFQPITLEEKANVFTRQVEERHNRMGFIAPSRLKEPYDVESWEPSISDNDGLKTARYGAAQAFRYAVTGGPEAKKLAKRSFDACKWLVDITHEEGFPARVIIPADWPEPVNEIYDHEFNIRRQQNDPFWKDITPRFVKSENGKYLWKCDTSSDELSGHYFFYAVYYDLVAETEKEKQRVREVVADITDHLIRHGFYLQDHDGKPTRWAYFSPHFFNSLFGWEQEELNSMQMLSFLKVAYHVTGNDKYRKTAEELRNKYNYHFNVLSWPPTDDFAPWDKSLYLLTMYGLINYEENPKLKVMYRESLENAWQKMRREMSPFVNVTYAALAQRFNHSVDNGLMEDAINIYDTTKFFRNAKTYARISKERLYIPDSRMDGVMADVRETLQKFPIDL
ncbi:MAG: two-component regulator propeller domain-containing protein, partial [Bacteroidales bacterium]